MSHDLHKTSKAIGVARDVLQYSEVQTPKSSPLSIRRPPKQGLYIGREDKSIWSAYQMFSTKCLQDLETTSPKKSMRDLQFCLRVQSLLALLILALPCDSIDSDAAKTDWSAPFLFVFNILGTPSVSLSDLYCKAPSHCHLSSQRNGDDDDEGGQKRAWQFK